MRTGFRRTSRNGPSRQRGELVSGKPRHYIRINPADPDKPGRRPTGHRRCSRLPTAGDASRPQYRRRRFFATGPAGRARRAMIPLIVDSIAVIDQVLKRDLPQGPVLAAL